MDREEGYRRKAEEAQRWADKATSEVERTAWLRVVQGWLDLIHKRSHGTDANGNRGSDPKPTGPSSR